MTALAAGTLTGTLILVLGPISTAWIALAIASVVIVAGAADYVRTH